MFLKVTTWLVTVEGERETWDSPVRVPETRLVDFLSVLVFNRYEFKVEREPEPKQVAE